MRDFLIMRFCFTDNFHIAIIEVFVFCCFLHFDFLVFSPDSDIEATKDILSRAFYLLFANPNSFLIFIWKDLAVYFICKILCSSFISRWLFSHFAS